MSIRHRMSAYTELFGRYRSVFAHYWQHRDELTGAVLLEHEAEFLPAALSLQAKPVSPAARLLAGVLMTLVAVLVAWSILGKIDIVVNASGKVIPSGYTKTIAAVEVASVRALHVKEGQPVKAGDVLIELDASASDAERDKAIGDETVGTLQVARSRALIAAVDSLKPPQLPRMAKVPEGQWLEAKRNLEGQYQDFIAKLNLVDDNIRRYQEALPLAEQREADYRELSKNHDVSIHAYLEKEQARIDLERQLMEARNQRIELIAQTKKEAHDALTEGDKVSRSSSEDALRADSHSKVMILTAPVDGTVQQLTVHTVGGVVPAAQPLMEVVPKDDGVEVEAFMENKDIGFVQEGQSSEVKVDAFDYTKYGTVAGQVSHVSRDAIQDEKKGLIYSVKVALDRTSMAVDGKDMQLSPGMSVDVEIKTGERRIIEYVLSPLIRHQRESLNER